MSRTIARVSSALICVASSLGCSSGDEHDLSAIRSEVIYGADNRQDPFAYADQAFAARALEFTAALIPTSQIDASNPNDIDIGNRTLQERFDVCADVRFAEQQALADCSATLIDDDIMLTAGHCINNCGDSRFVFDYAAGPDGSLPTITSDDVYACSSFLAYTQSNTGLDYAVVRLNRPVVGREPALVRSATSLLPVGTELLVTGFPSGLPLKIADDAELRSNASNGQLFVANLDTFRGNSGSGVFDANTEELVGILVRGAPDYVQDGDCLRPNVCAEDGCRGEDVIYAFHAVQDVCEETSSAICACGDGVCSGGETPSSCSADCQLEVLYDDHAPQASWVTPGIRVRNVGSTPVNVGGAVARYYFSKEPTGTLQATCWGCSVTPSTSFAQVPSGGCAGATHYLDVTLPNVTLGALGVTEPYRIAFHASSWQAFNQTNDYSYAGSAWNYAPNSAITLYRNGARVFGEEPCPGIDIPIPQ
jgi:V8-like Glu-specific endopeptidase